MTLSMMSQLERLVIHPSSIVSGESNVLMVSCAGGLQNLFACSYYSTKVAVRGTNLNKSVKKSSELV